jgi:hypothetical protein
MRRCVNALAVLFLAVSLSTTTAHAAPRRTPGDGDWSPVKKIVQVIKKVVRKFDGSDLTWPKP